MDEMLAGFLERQREEALALAERSPLLELEPVSGSPPDRWIARFACRGLVRGPYGPVEAEGFSVGIWFPDDYLRRASTFECLTMLHAPGASRVFHPNCGASPLGADCICIGHLVPGTPLVDVVLQCFEVLSWQNVTLDERNALDREACEWGRANLHRLPIDRRSILGRELPPRALGALAAQAAREAREVPS